MKLPLVLASALTALLPVLSTSSADTDVISGVYECEGTTANGTPYRGTVEIVRNNSMYEVLWTFGPRERYLGFGLVNDNVLAVSVLAGMPGVVAYKIERSEKGARLVGQWTVPNEAGQVFSETLTRVGDATTRPAKPRKPQSAEPPPRGKLRLTGIARSA
jgi:hypothetical protein